MANDAENPRPAESLGPFLPLIAVFAVADFLLPVMAMGGKSESLAMFLAFVFGGAVCGQISLLCLWAVLGTQRLLARWPGTLAVTELLYGAMFLGVGVGEPHPAPDPVLHAAVAGGLILPSLFLGAQVPLWILRLLTGWRIVFEATSAGGSLSQSRQFALQHIFGATTAVAMGLGLAGLALRLLDGRDAIPAPWQWLELISSGPIFGCLALLWILPCLWAAFIARDKATSAAIIAVYAAVMSFLIPAVMDVLSASGPNTDGPTLLAFCLFHGSLATVLLGSLHLLRYSGYTLLRPGRREPPAASAGSSPFADADDPSLPPSA